MLKGKRVLLVNAIRSDTPSGGNTSTQGMLTRLRADSSVQELSLNPASRGWGALGFALTTLPAALFVLWARWSGQVWLEFLLRASPLLFLRCLWVRWRMQPEVVVFNHHASFLYVSAFPGCQRVLVWHDVPSLKRDGRRDIAFGARRCAAFERMALARAQFNVTFSFDDDKGLRRLHGRSSTIIPVIDYPPRPRRKGSPAGSWLLIGNWTRAENCEGAQAFLLACAELSLQLRKESLAHAIFHVAGYGSEAFIAGLVERNPSLNNIKILVSGRYGDMTDFNESALLAPLMRGAGIKLKTIEAWAADIPVIGTAQAFTGLSKNIWRYGGLRVSSIAEMARLCMSLSVYQKFEADINVLDGVVAYEAYQSAIKNTGCLS